jgi:hypothetical protein
VRSGAAAAPAARTMEQTSEQTSGSMDIGCAQTAAGCGLTRRARSRHVRL